MQGHPKIDPPSFDLPPKPLAMGEQAESTSTVRKRVKALLRPTVGISAPLWSKHETNALIYLWPHCTANEIVEYLEANCPPGRSIKSIWDKAQRIGLSKHKAKGGNRRR